MGHCLIYTARTPPALCFHNPPTRFDLHTVNEVGQEDNIPVLTPQI